MRKLRLIVLFGILLVVFLVVLAFLYLDLSGHKSFRYKITVGGVPSGYVDIDRYSTEEKVIYRSNAEYEDLLNYPTIEAELFLKKKSMTPLKFVEEAIGVHGRKRLTLFVQEGEVTNFLFSEQPRFVALNGFPTGKKTMIFSPDDIMLYLPIMEKYNYWKKGAQFFEVMIPMDVPLPPMRDKIEVKDLKNEYIPVMGSKVEADSFVISSGSLPEAKVYVSKYSHRILAVCVEQRSLKIGLTGYIDTPGKRLELLVGRGRAILRRGKLVFKAVMANSDLFVRDAIRKDLPCEEKKVLSDGERSKGKERKGVRLKDVSFEGRNLFLSGGLWMPAGEGPFPAALIVPKEGPITNGEEAFTNSTGRFLSKLGFVVLVFDGPGAGKGQENVIGMDDEKKIQNIEDAVNFLRMNPHVIKNSITIVGHEGVGYLILKAAAKLPFVRSCILFGAPPRARDKDMLKKDVEKNVYTLLKTRGYGSFDERFIGEVTEKMYKQIRNVLRSGEAYKYFMGVKLPLKAYRELLRRRHYETMLSFDRPLLFVVGRDDGDVNPQAIDGIKKLFQKKNKLSKVAVFRNLGEYVGKAIPDGDSRKFVIKKDLLVLMKKWIVKNGIERAKSGK